MHSIQENHQNVSLLNWEAKLGCNCGVNAKFPKQACINHMSYQSRCSCFKACHGCTQKCRCKNCGNPYGQQPRAITVRTRVPHKCQKTLPSSELFVQERGGEVPCGRWSALENYVFISVVRHLQDCLNEDPPITAKTKESTSLPNWSESAATGRTPNAGVTVTPLTHSL